MPPMLQELWAEMEHRVTDFIRIAPGIDIFSYNFSGPRVTDHDGAINTNGIEISNNSWGDAVMIPNCSHYGNYESDAPAFDEIITGKYGRK